MGCQLSTSPYMLFHGMPAEHISIYALPWDATETYILFPSFLASWLLSIKLNKIFSDKILRKQH
jgi:hypothetical protein